MIKLKVFEKKFGLRVIIKDEFLNINKGDFLVITGPSGAGKSTFMNIIGLIDNSYSGTYYLNDERLDLSSIKKNLELRCNFFSYIFQDSFINERQSVARNILSSISIDKQYLYKDKIPEVLNAVGLDYIKIKDSVNNLSGGEKQRLAMARAIIKKPQLILADEPTASLDRKNKAIIIDILKKFSQSGGTVVMITHDLDLIDKEMIIRKIKSI